MSGTAGAPQISPPSGSQCPAPHLCVGWLLAASGPHLHFAGEGSGAVSISATNYVSLAPGFAKGEDNERATSENIRGAGLCHRVLPPGRFLTPWYRWTERVPELSQRSSPPSRN